eukprot:1611488-Heterocapsa_arctica.AAC.1
MKLKMKIPKMKKKTTNSKGKMRTRSRGGWRPRDGRCPTRSIGRPSGRSPVPPWAGSAGCRLPSSPGVPCLPCLAQRAS